MYRRTLQVLASQGKRTVVRDPRKRHVPTSSMVSVPPQRHEIQEQPRPPPFLQQPSLHPPQTLASSLGSYVVAGVGVTLGVVLVRVVLGF
jgi:hypothetical protein